MSQTVYTGLTVEVRKSADGQFYDFGVWVDGVFAPFFKRKAGGLDDAIALEVEAQKERDKQAAADAAALAESQRQAALAEANQQTQTGTSGDATQTTQ